MAARWVSPHATRGNIGPLVGPRPSRSWANDVTLVAGTCIMPNLVVDLTLHLRAAEKYALVEITNAYGMEQSNMLVLDGGRLDYNSTVSESYNPPATEYYARDLQDGDCIDASMLQKGSQIDNEKESGLITNSNSSVIQLKERCKSDSFRFVEYWVPVQISNVQLEQYCDILLSNASILRASSKVDSVEAVHDVLISTRKCCSHPYVVDPKLKLSLNKGLEPIEYLDVEIKASGKLQLLDSMLQELRKNALRVLILFQSIRGSGRVMADYLDDLLRQRFGSDSYERIDKGLSNSKKQAAMKTFNDKNNRRFVFLLETCACLPSIKLSSVDTIIIFDSDWNPMNDIKSLQKITLDSEFELIKIFRLYSSFTVEEKALILAKQNKTLDVNLQNINWSTSHMLLMWGASCLFDELKVFHDSETSGSNVKSLFGQPLLKEAMHEFSSLLSQDGEHIDSSNCSTLLKVQKNGVTYRANFSLFGELKFRIVDGESPQFFWTKLLEGKQFRWKYINSSSQRSRKRVHHFDGSVNGPDLISEGAAKKRRKVSNNIVDQPSSKSEGEKLSTVIKADRYQGNNAESEQKSTHHNEQRSLHLLLKPEIRKLCDVLNLPDNVKSTIDNFLEYVMNNHHVNREPSSILQAFQISLAYLDCQYPSTTNDSFSWRGGNKSPCLCWTAASMLKHKLDYKTSLTRAEEDLNFKCKKEEVDYIYSMLRCLKKIFLYRTGNYNDTGSPKVSELSNRAYSCTGVAREVELFKKDMSKSIKEIQKKCEKRLKKLLLLQEEEKQRLRAAIEEEKAKFEGRYKIQSAVIRSCSPNDVMRMENLRGLNIEYEKGIEELKCQHETYLKDLEDKQLAEIQKFQCREATWVEDVKSWAQKELLNIVASKELRTEVESLQTCDQIQPHNGLKNHFAEGKGHDDRVEAVAETVTDNSPLSDREDLLGLHGTVSITDCPENGTAVNPPSSMEQISDGGAVNKFSDRELRPSDRPNNNTLLSSRHQNADGVPSSILDGHIPVEVQETSNEVDTVCVLKEEVPVETPGTVDFTHCPQNASPLNPPSSMDQLSDRGPLDVPGIDRVLSPRPCQTASSSDGPVTTSISNTLLQQQTTNGIPSSIPSTVDCHNDIGHLTNAVLVDKRTMSDQQEGAPKTMTELSQETPVSRSINVMDPPDQVQQLSVESSPNHDTSGEMQLSSKQPELVSSAVDVVPADQSNHVSLIMKPIDQVQQLSSAERPSSRQDSTNFPLATEVEHQPTVVPNPDVQPASNLELDSHSHEVVHPASNSDPVTITPSEVRMQSSETINLSTPLEINYQHMQAETRSASRMMHLSYDPLKNELDRIRKVTEQTMKYYEDMKLRLKTDFEKELEELRRKYDIKFQQTEVEFKQTKATLDTSFNIVRMNKFLADAFRSKCSILKASSSSGMLQDSSFAQQQLVQPSRQQSSSWSSLVAGSSSRGPSATSLQSPSPTGISQHMAPPIRGGGYSTSGFVSNITPRLPIINSIPSPVGNLQAGTATEIRAPAPHLQPYRP
ncbi:Helicase protein MOM1, partial [Mucuna pruriens]